MTQRRARPGQQPAASSPQLATSITGLCNAAIEAGLLLAIIIAPLYFNPRTQHTFEPDKAALLRSVVLIAFLPWLIKRLETRFPDTHHAPRTTRHASRMTHYALRIASPLFPALLLLAAYLIATATSILPRISFWGSYERGQGLYTFFAYIALFLLTWESVRTSGQRQRLIDTVLLVSLPVSAYAVLQHFGLDPLVFQTGGAAVTVRAISTLGNPIFLGAYLVMVIPLTVVQVYREWQPAGRGQPRLVLGGLYGTLLILQLVALLFAQSRGPVLGMLGGLGFGALAWVARQGARRVVAGVVVSLLLGAALMSLAQALLPNTEGLGWLGQLIDPASRTGRQRLLIWEGVVNLVTDEPARMWVGYGPETLRDVIGRHIPSEIAALKPDEDFDRAHNRVLDLWATTGLLGVIAYLLVMGTSLYWGLHLLGLGADSSGRRLFLLLAVAGTLVGGLVAWFGVSRWIGVTVPLGLLGGVTAHVVWCGLRSQRRRRPVSQDELLAVALLAAVVGHVVETLVGIAIVATQTLFWIWVAVIAGLAVHADEIRSSKSKSRNLKFTLHSWGCVTGVALGLVSFSLLSAGQTRGGLAWGVIASATLLFGVARFGVDRSGNGDAAARYLGLSAATALSLWLLIWLPWPPMDITHPTVAVFAYTLIALGVLVVSLSGGVDRFRGRVGQLSWVCLAVGGILTVAALVAIWLTNINLVRADVYYKQGLGVSAAGDLRGTVQAVRVSAALAPHEDRYHSAIGAAYAQMAQVAQEAGTRQTRLLEAEAHLQEAQHLDPYRADHLRNLGVLYRWWAGLTTPEQREPLLRKALTYYEQAALQNPVSVRVWREWGETYTALGEWDAAIQRYAESLRLNAGFVETWLLLAHAQLRIADYGGARQAYSQAVALDETRVLEQSQAAAASSPDPIPHQALALVYAALGRSELAMAEAEAAGALMEPKPPNWLEFLETLQRPIE